MQVLITLWGLGLISQLGRHFWPKYSFVGGLPIDYLSVTVYVSEVLTLLLLIFLRPKLPHALKHWWLWLIPAVNILLAFNPPLALFYWLKFIFLIWMVIAATQLPDKLVALLIRGLRLGLGITVVMVLGQLLFQRSLGGIWYWLGERQFTLTTPGIAKLDMLGRLFLRPYGSFSHPNSLAGFALITGLLFSALEKRLVGWNRWVGIGIFILILLTGSRVTIAACLMFMILRQVKTQHLAGKVTKVFLVVSVVITVLLLTVPANPSLGQSLSQRLVLAQTQLTTVWRSPLWGVGLGNSIPATYFYSVVYRFNLWYQPAHNLWVLLLVELGIPGLLAASWGFLKLQQHLVSRHLFVWWAGWQALLLTSLFDHYWFTLPQNRLIFALYLGLTLRALAHKTNIMKR